MSINMVVGYPAVAQKHRYDTLSMHISCVTKIVPTYFVTCIDVSGADSSVYIYS